MWYNYELDGQTGWMSQRDDRLLHGGCIVKKGMKYIHCSEQLASSAGECRTLLILEVNIFKTRMRNKTVNLTCVAVRELNSRYF